MVAWSPAETGARLTGSGAGGGGRGREGSGVVLGVAGPVWVGFHIALTKFLFCPEGTGLSKAGAIAEGPKKWMYGLLRAFRPGQPTRGHK